MFSVIINIITIILLVIIVTQLHDLQKNYLHHTTLYLLWTGAKKSWIIRFALFALQVSKKTVKNLFAFRIKLERRK